MQLNKGFLYDKNSNGYIAYHKLVNELLMKGVL